MSKRFCKDCRWYGPAAHMLAAATCSGPNASTADRVTGLAHPAHEREWRPFNKGCGPKGRLFEPKGSDQ